MSELLEAHPYLTSAVLSLLLGSVVGLEREAMIQKSGNRSIAGIRTFAFIGIMGSIAGVLGQLVSPLLTVAAFLSVLLLVAMGYMAEQKQNKIGLITEITSLITFLTGVLTAYNQMFLAIIITIAVMTVLSQRKFLHGFAGKVENQELFASIKFAIIAFVILPLLPDQTFDPWEALNPHKIWLIVVMISGLNFAGYILSKIFGERKGMAMIGFFGGFISSTAMNLSLAEQSKEKGNAIQTKSLLLALFLAQAASLILTEIELFIVNRELSIKAAIPIGTAILILFAFALFNYRTFSSKKAVRMKRDIATKSPFTLSEALIFGGIFSVMMLTIKVLFTYIGNTGLYITSAFSGLISLDAITVTVAEVTGNGVSISDGLALIMLSIVMSILQKIIVLILFAEKKFKLQGVVFLLLVIIVFGAFAFTLTPA